jgi:hypothetical protein
MAMSNFAKAFVAALDSNISWLVAATNRLLASIKQSSAKMHLAFISGQANIFTSVTVTQEQ